MKANLILLFISLLTPLCSQIVKLDSSRLPICIIDTRGKIIPNEPKILAHMKIIYNGPGKMNHANAKTYNYNNFIAIETRGNSSQSYPQKQYGIELRDSVTGNDLDASLMGMPEEEDWVLYAPYNDISLLRNVLTYHLWNEMGHWGPRTRFCEVILNNEYVGVYVLMESIKRGPSRLDIAKLTAADTSGRDLTGGYIMKIDKVNSATDLSFISKVKSTNNQNITWLHDYPDSEDIVNSQKNYIQKYIDSVELSIAANNFSDPVNGYRKFLSLNSFIDYFLINEFSRNIDAYKASSFFYKEKLQSDGTKGMFKAGPIWDYNFAFGNAGFCSGAQTNGWMYDGCVPATLPTPTMWRRLLQDTNYLNAVKCRYLELRKTILDTAYIMQYLNRYALDTLDAPQKRHFAKWRILGTNPGGFNAYIATSYVDEMNRLRTWIRNRLAWMDQFMTGRCIPPPAIAKIEIPLDPECFSGQRPPLVKNQPFDTSPFNYPGKEQVNNFPANIIRWVLVELRSPSDSSVLISRRAALLRSDSAVVDTNFKAGVLFPNVSSWSKYFLVVRYDAQSYVMSKISISLPNDNDYNLNRPYNVQNLAKNSPIVYNSNWPGMDTFNLCLGSKLILNDSNLLKAGYSFMNQNISIEGASFYSVSAHELTLSFDSAGIYLINMYLRCSDQSLMRSGFYVNVVPNPIAIIHGADTFCLGDSLMLSTDFQLNYLWSTGANSIDILIKNAGTYSLTVSDVNGCTASASKLVLNYREIQGKLIAQNVSPTICKIYFTPDDINNRYSYKWSTGATSDTIETAELIIHVTVTDSFLCSKMYSILCNWAAIQLEDVHVFNVIPNPSDGNFSIKSTKAIQKLTIYTLPGSILFNQDFNSGQQDVYDVEFKHFKPGIYFGTIHLKMKSYSFRFVVN